MAMQICSLLIAQLLIAHFSLLIAHCSLLIAHCSLLIAHCSLLIAHCSLLIAHCSCVYCHLSASVRLPWVWQFSNAEYFPCTYSETPLEHDNIVDTCDGSFRAYSLNRFSVANFREIHLIETGIISCFRYSPRSSN